VRKTFFSLAVDPERLAALHAIKEQQRIGLSTQIRNGIRLWLAQQGMDIKEDQQQRKVNT
jgi:hypothetical protein